MKKLMLFIILILTEIVFGQAKYLGSGDSILVRSRDRTTYTLVYMRDSLNTPVDTCVIELYAPNKKQWSTIAVMDMKTHDDWYSSLIPGNGIANWYLINMINASDNIRIRRTNVTTRSQKTYVEFNSR